MSTTDPYPNAFLLEPDEIKVKEIRLDEKVNMEVTVTDNKITASKDNGKYYYSVVVHWSELQLQARYDFAITVESKG